MARRTTKTKPLEDQAEALKHAQGCYLDAARERDDARARAATLSTQLDAIAKTPQDGAVCARLAVILLPDEDPTTTEPRELEIEIQRRAQKVQRAHKHLQQAAQCLDGDIDVTMDLEELAEAISDAAKDTEKSKKRLEEMEKAAGGEEELSDLITWRAKSEYTPEQLERAIELLDLLGISGHALTYILGAGDLPNALRAIGRA